MNEGAADGRLRLSGRLDAYAAAQTREALLRHLATQDELRLDLSAVESADATGLQLLWAVARSAGRDGKPFVVEGLSPALRQAGAELGLDLEAQPWARP